MTKKMVGDDLTLTSNFKVDLARFSPCFSNLLSYIHIVNHRLASINLLNYERADEPFIEASNFYNGKQGWLKNQN